MREQNYGKSDIWSMEHGTNAITWIIACDSWETLRQAKQFAQSESDPDRTFDDIAISFPNGIEQRVTERHRLGDYFERVQIVPSDSHSTSFKLVFQPRQGAKRYWKDLMVRILGSLRQDFSGVSIEPANR
jgi:hypothetical protein